MESSPEGYPRLAAFLDSDDNFMIFRRFGYIQTRLLLEKQARLLHLEQKLDQLDTQDEIENPMRLRTIDLDSRDSEIRDDLLCHIERTFCEYCRLA